jgi:phage baseplate assembly protein W
MAYGFRRIAPGDFNPNTGVGVSLPFNAPSCFSSTYTSSEAIKNNLINWFLTNKNERPLNPNFGGNLRQFIFQQLATGTLEDVEENIQQQLNTYFPGVIVNELSVTQNQTTQAINISITYSLQGTGITDNLQIELT